MIEKCSCVFKQLYTIHHKKVEVATPKRDNDSLPHASRYIKHCYNKDNSFPAGASFSCLVECVNDLKLVQLGVNGLF